MKILEMKIWCHAQGASSFQEQTGIFLQSAVVRVDALGLSTLAIAEEVASCLGLFLLCLQFVCFRNQGYLGEMPNC